MRLSVTERNGGYCSHVTRQRPIRANTSSKPPHNTQAERATATRDNRNVPAYQEKPANESSSPVPASTSATIPSRHRLLGVLGAGIAGLVLAVQSRINGALGARLGDGLETALISFGMGLVVLVPWAALTPSARRGLRRVVDELRSRGALRWWQCLGGVCGAYLVFSQGVSAGVLGLALFTVAVVAGQVISGLVVDRFGLGPAGPQRVTGARTVGAGLTVVAVVVAVSAKLGGASGSWMVVLPLLAGIGMAWQQAVNGRIKQTADSTLAATTLNFATGTFAALLALAAQSAVRGVPTAPPAEPWLYVGGLLGIFVIGGAALLVRYTGVLLLSMGMVAGQLVGALLLDLFLPAPGSRVETSTVVGIVLTLLAVAIATFAGSGRTGSGRSRLPR